MGLWRVALVALFVMSLLPQLPHGHAAAGDPPARYIVVFRDVVEPRAKTDDIERRLGFTSDFRYTAALRGFAAQLALLRSDPDVVSIAADRIVHIVDTVPIVAGDTAPTGVRRVNAATTTTAHAASTVNVAVIDSGIDLAQKDLNAVSGKNCITPGTPAKDDNGHGTHVAGTIAAKNNGSGVIGVAPGTKVYAVKVINSAGSGTDAQVVCGIDWVTANAAVLNIKVANVSLGGDGVDDGNCGKTNNDVVHQAICRSVATGVTYVVAAGNSAQNFAANYPASYDEVLTVTAMADTDGQPGALGSPTCIDSFFETDDAAASFSNFTTIDSPDVAHTIAGPGVCITSTKMGGGTTTMSGTSMATPHVAGLAALCLGEAGKTGPCTGLTPAQIITKLRQTAAGAMTSFGFSGDPSHPIANFYYGYLAAVDPPRDTTPPVMSSIAVSSISDSDATVTWTTDEVSDSRVDYGTTIAYGLSSVSAAPVTSHVMHLTGLTQSTTYHYQVRSADGAGNVATSTDRTFSTIAASSDLALSAAPLPASVDTGATVRYRLSATNGGPSTATAVTVADTLPANASFVAASSTQGTCSASGQSVSCAIGTLLANPVLVDRPTAYWRLGDPANATTAADTSGSNAGTYSGVTLEAPGAVPGDSAASFAGGAVASIPAAAALDLSTAVSVEAWVKPAAAGSNGGIFEKTIGGNVNTQYLLLIESGFIEFRGKQAAGGYVTAGGPALAAGTWTHVVGTYDGSTLRLYVNGAPVGSAAAATLASGSGPAFIGRLGAEGSNPGILPFSGVIDEVAVYSGVLSPSRVLAHYTNAQTNVTTARVTIDVRASSGGTLVNSAQLSATEPDPNAANNSVTQSVTATDAAADLALSAVSQPANAAVNSTVRYIFSTTNAGPSGATSVSLADTLPSNATFLAASSTQGTCTSAPPSATCAIGALVVNPVLVDRPVAYWRLGDPANATTAADTSGSNPGAYSGVTLEAPGAVPGDSAATFGGSGVVSIPAATALDLSTAVSVEAWVKPAAAGSNGGIFEKTVGGNVNTGYLLLMEGGYIEFRGKQAAGSYVTAAGPVLAAGTWTQVIGSYDGSTLRLYVNGAQVGSAAAGTLASGSGPSFIGRLGAEGPNPGILPFSGVIDEVAVYSGALSSARVLAHYTNAATNVTTARVTIDVRASAGGAFTNVAQVSGAQVDPNNANNSVTQTINVTAPAADLALSAAPLPASVDTGATVRYRLSATNGGPSTATAVTVADTLPANASFVAASSTQGTCSASGQSVSCAIGTLLANPVLVDHPAAFWRLSEYAGAGTAADSAGTNAGSYSGVGLEAPGAVPGDSAASFAGGAVVSIPASSALDLSTALSVEAWVKPAAAGADGGIFEKTIGGNVNTQYLLLMQGGYIEFRGKQAASGYVTAAGPVLAAGTWSHVVGTYDGSMLLLYVNGAQVGSAAAGTLASGSGPSFIGRLGAEGLNPGILPFSGTLDEVAVYATALSPSRVLAHYTNAATNVTTARVTIDARVNSGGTLVNSAQLSATEPDPNAANNSVTQSVTITASVADLKAKGVALPDPAAVGGTLRYTVTVSDAGPSGATNVSLGATLPSNATFLAASSTQGTCTSAPTSATCAIGTLAVNPVLFDHPAAYWRLGDPTSTAVAADTVGSNPGTYSGVSLETAGAVPGDPAATFCGSGVVSIPASTALDLSIALSVEAWVKPAASGSNGGIFEKTIGGSVNTGYLLLMEGGYIEFRGKQAAATYVTAGGGQLAAGTWSHVVGTYDGSMLRLYVNGAQVGSAAAGTLASGSGPAYIGRLGAEAGNPGILPFSGVIDEVAVYSGTLSPARVLAHYTNAQTNVTTARVTIDVKPTAAGTATASAGVSATESDPNPADNTLGFSTLVN